MVYEESPLSHGRIHRRLPRLDRPSTLRGDLDLERMPLDACGIERGCERALQEGVVLHAAPHESSAVCITIGRADGVGMDVPGMQL